MHWYHASTPRAFRVAGRKGLSHAEGRDGRRRSGRARAAARLQTEPGPQGRGLARAGREEGTRPAARGGGRRPPRCRGAMQGQVGEQWQVEDSGHSWGRAITAGGECSNAEGWSGRTWKNGAEKWSGRCLGGSHQVEFGVSPVPFGGPAGAEMTKSMLKSKRNQLKCSSALRAKW